MSATLDAACSSAARTLAAGCGLQTPVAFIEARALARHVLGCDDGGLILRGPEPLAEAKRLQFDELVQQRAGGIPIAHLTGTREFYGIAIACSPSALIPRPETELLVDLALEHIHPQERGPAADWGTGTGAIACALAANRNLLQIDAIDIDGKAAQLARANAERWSDRISVRESSWDAAEPSSYCLIAANPPYIASSEAADLLASGQLRDPLRALDGGKDGLDCIRSLAHAAHAALLPGGMLALEHGASQQQEAASVLEAAGFADVRGHCDLARLPRAVTGVRA